MVLTFHKFYKEILHWGQDHESWLDLVVDLDEIYSVLCPKNHIIFGYNYDNQKDIDKNIPMLT